MWPFSRRRKPPELFTVPTVEFLGEQDGPPERELKDALRAAFDQHPSVARAYLCRVRHECSGDRAVALAISAPENRQLVDQVGKIFWKMFGRGAVLDVVFVTTDSERRLAKVCTPFYLASGHEEER